MPANAGLFASLRTTSQVGRPTTENCGVLGSSPSLAIKKPLQMGVFSDSGRYV
jgi:hypothetical protein